MENAGRAAAAVLQRLHPKGRVVGVVGSGNNGGDALVTLRTLASWGRDVCAVTVADREHPEPLAHGWTLPTITDQALDQDGWARLLGSASVLVDGVLGTGVRGAPRARQAAAIEAVNASGRPVLAMDVPSGIDPTTGDVPGEAVRAASTVAFGAPKLGALLHPARAFVGRLLAVEIGFPPLEASESRAYLATPLWAAARLPGRSTDTHKNAVGRVLMVGGGKGMAGAAVLAARAALRAGAGMVRIASDPANREIVQTSIPEAVWVDTDDAAALAAAVSASDACVVGPGLGRNAWAVEVLRRVLEDVGRVSTDVATPVLLDADALNLVAEGRVELGLGRPEAPLLLTPHPGEMARLLDGGSESRASDPVGRAREAAARFGCAVLLKGSPSVVAAPGKSVAVDSQGSSDLATAGMGDTLAGVCGTFLAQGLEPAEAGAVGLCVTGRAARLAAMGVSLTPSDVVETIRRAMTSLAEVRSSPPEHALGYPFVTLDAEPAW